MTFPLWHDAVSNLRAVDDRLYVGGASAPTCRSLRPGAWVDLTPDSLGRILQEHRVRSVLDRAPRCRILHWDLREGAPLPAELLFQAVTLDVIARPLLVTCGAGTERSASVAYALLRVRGLTHAEALRRVTTVGGPCADGVALRSARAWVEALDAHPGAP